MCFRMQTKIEARMWFSKSSCRGYAGHVLKPTTQIKWMRISSVCVVWFRFTFRKPVTFDSKRQKKTWFFAIETRKQTEFDWYFSITYENNALNHWNQFIEWTRVDYSFGHFYIWFVTMEMMWPKMLTSFIFVCEPP